MSSIVSTIVGMMILLIFTVIFINPITSEDLEVYDFQGTIAKKEIQRTQAFLGTDEDYYFLIKTNNVSIVEEVSFETYLRYDVGDSYNYSLNNFTDKRELRELGATP